MGLKQKYFHLNCAGFWKRQGTSNLVGGKATNKIMVIGSESVEAEAVEAASKPPATKMPVLKINHKFFLRFFKKNVLCQG